MRHFLNIDLFRSSPVLFWDQSDPLMKASPQTQGVEGEAAPQVQSRREVAPRGLMGGVDYQGPDVSSDQHQYARAQAVQHHAWNMAAHHSNEALDARREGDQNREDHHTAKHEWYKENWNRANNAIQGFRNSGVEVPTQQHHEDWADHYLQNPQLYQGIRKQTKGSVPTHLRRARTHAEISGTEAGFAGRLEDPKKMETAGATMERTKEEHMAAQRQPEPLKVFDEGFEAPKQGKVMPSLFQEKVPEPKNPEISPKPTQQVETGTVPGRVRKSLALIVTI